MVDTDNCIWKSNRIAKSNFEKEITGSEELLQNYSDQDIGVLVKG